jgi:hypothetical protein
MIHLVNWWEATCIGYVNNSMWMGVRYIIYLHQMLKGTNEYEYVFTFIVLPL